MTNHQQIPLFVINLKRSKERRDHILGELDKYGLDFEMVEAIDGKELPKEKIDKLSSDAKIFQGEVGRPLNPGEIGCTMSHLSIYKKIIEEEIPSAAIIEDDAILSREFKELLNENTVSHFPRKWEFVFAGYKLANRIGEELPVKTFFIRKRVLKNVYLARPMEFCWTTIAYIITLEGAKKLYKAGHPIRMPADFLTGNSERYGVRMYAVDFPVVRSNLDFFGTNSTIQNPGQDKKPDDAGLWDDTYHANCVVRFAKKCLFKIGLLKKIYSAASLVFNKLIYYYRFFFRRGYIDI